MTEIVPSVFATDIKGFRKRMILARKLSSDVHVDFMDGIFVEKKSPAIKDMFNIKGSTVHLMAASPEKYFDELTAKRASAAVVHYEACPDIERTIDATHKKKIKCYVAIKPETPVNVLFKLLNKADGFLIMSVNPGAEGQTMAENVFSRVKELRRVTNKPILVDGGIRVRNAKKLKNTGASVLTAGSSIFKSVKPEEMFDALKKAVS